PLLLIGIRRDRESGEPVQASISLVDRDRAQMYLLVQGIRRDAVRKGHNLDIADTYALLRRAEALGIREVNFGRGMPAYKRSLSANRFHLLNNWLWTAASETRAEIAALAERMRAALGLAGDEASAGGIPLS